MFTAVCSSASRSSKTVRSPSATVDTVFAEVFFVDDFASMIAALFFDDLADTELASNTIVFGAFGPSDVVQLHSVNLYFRVNLMKKHIPPLITKEKAHLFNGIQWFYARIT